MGWTLYDGASDGWFGRRWRRRAERALAAVVVLAAVGFGPARWALHAWIEHEVRQVLKTVVPALPVTTTATTAVPTTSTPSSVVSSEG